MAFEMFHSMRQYQICFSVRIKKKLRFTQEFPVSIGLNGLLIVHEKSEGIFKNVKN